MISYTTEHCSILHRLRREHALATEEYLVALTDKLLALQGTGTGVLFCLVIRTPALIRI